MIRYHVKAIDLKTKAVIYSMYVTDAINEVHAIQIICSEIMKHPHELGKDGIKFEIETLAVRTH